MDAGQRQRIFDAAVFEGIALDAVRRAVRGLGEPGGYDFVRRRDGGKR